MSLRSRLSPQTTALCIFTALFFLTALHLRTTNSWRDPSSLFFDPTRAFARPYSTHREDLASSWISTYNITHLPPSVPSPPKSSPNPTFCIGIPTIQRPGARYFSTLIGSLLAPLSPSQRAEIHLVPFIVSTDPTQHLAYTEPWLGHLADNILTYAPTDPDFGVLKTLEVTDTWHKQKPIRDYTKLLDECRHTTTAEYIVVLEDDVIAAETWYGQMVEGVRELEGRVKRGEWVYLRMFYNERLLGWNGEEWRSYFWACLLVFVGCVGGVWVGKRVAGKFFTTRTCAVVLLVCVPACMGLYFAAGRLTVAPLRRGVNRMDNYGCCSQAFLFPRDQVPLLVDYYGKKGEGFIDMFTEDYANEKGLARYAITPSPFQHIGFKSSKSESPSQWGRSNTENIFNWSFEKNKIP